MGINGAVLGIFILLAGVMIFKLEMLFKISIYWYILAYLILVSISTAIQNKLEIKTKNTFSNNYLSMQLLSLETLKSRFRFLGSPYLIIPPMGAFILSRLLREFELSSYATDLIGAFGFLVTFILVFLLISMWVTPHLFVTSYQLHRISKLDKITTYVVA